MKYLIITGNPKQDGLCHAVTEEARKGVEAGRAIVDILSVTKIERCHVCGTGWGTCRGKQACAVLGMTDLRHFLKESSAILACLIPLHVQLYRNSDRITTAAIPQRPSTKVPVVWALYP